MNAISVKSALIPAQRRSLILSLIRQSGIVSIKELADAVSVSLATIRRDLNWLSENGRIQRSHGGASLNDSRGTTFEPAFQVASRLARREKAAIGRLAAERLRDHESVIFDSSSTVYEAARHAAAAGLNLTAVTNDIRIAQLLAATPSMHLLVCGGTARPGSYTLLGEPGCSFLRRLHVDTALIGIHAITGANLCEASTEVAAAKRCMAAAAARVLVLADASKFNTLAFCNAFDIKDVNEIITDRRIDPQVRRRLEKQGIQVLIADPEAAGIFSAPGLLTKESAT